MRDQRIAGYGSIALGLGIATGVILGPLVLRVIEFRTSANIEHQFVGGEVVSLGIVAPTMIASGVLWLREHRLAPVLAIGPALYTVYTYVTAVVGQEYARYDGNVEKFFPLYAALVAGGGAITAYAWSRLGEAEVPMPSDGLRRTEAGIFLGLGGFFALAWAAQIRLVITGNPPADYQEGPTLFWLIKLLDFGFVIPALVTAGIGLLRRHPAAVKAAYGLTVFATCLGGAVAGMAVAMELKDDPSAQPALLAVALTATAGLAAVTVGLLRSYLRGTAEVRPPIGQRVRRSVRLLGSE